MVSGFVLVRLHIRKLRERFDEGVFVPQHLNLVLICSATASVST